MRREPRVHVQVQYQPDPERMVRALLLLLGTLAPKATVDRPEQGKVSKRRCNKRVGLRSQNDEGSTEQ